MKMLMIAMTGLSVIFFPITALMAAPVLEIRRWLLLVYGAPI
jgi:hypothetical protein